jgi:hypothetical protein
VTSCKGAMSLQLTSTEAVSQRYSVRESSALDAASLKCVWSGYPESAERCDCSVPAAVVTGAWARHMSDGPGFFHFVRTDGTWLGYGLSDGTVRGVYCPVHCAARDQRCAPADIARALSLV